MDFFCAVFENVSIQLLLEEFHNTFNNTCLETFSNTVVKNVSF